MLMLFNPLGFYFLTESPRRTQIFLYFRKIYLKRVVYILNWRDLALNKIRIEFYWISTHNKGMTSNTKKFQSFLLGQSKSNEQCSYEYRRNQRYSLTKNPLNFFRKRPRRRCNHSIVIISHQSPSRIRHSIRKKIRNLQ